MASNKSSGHCPTWGRHPTAWSDLVGIVMFQGDVIVGIASALDHVLASPLVLLEVRSRHCHTRGEDVRVEHDARVVHREATSFRGMPPVSEIKQFSCRLAGNVGRNRGLKDISEAVAATDFLLDTISWEFMDIMDIFMYNLWTFMLLYIVLNVLRFRTTMKRVKRGLCKGYDFDFAFSLDLILILTDIDYIRYEFQFAFFPDL
ncbi:unnamed protein product [Heligmosomoides polygyrus]|uniref:Ion_trans domain-containing protein n=1 Tax=Heligmosomoides polygyrus TaxID=6339 RepID=A0A183FQM3_HELPZ|nr:unnamed protein product [Heligmosomoides polygyrus]